MNARRDGRRDESRDERPEASSPPHSLEAEACVLGSIMLDPEVLAEIAGVVSEGDFWSPAHREIFQACQNLDRRSAPIDLMTVAEELRASGKLEAIGGTDYLARLVELTPSPANAPHYARVVADYARLRRLLHATHEIQKLCYEPGRDLGEAFSDIASWHSEICKELQANGTSAALRALDSVEPQRIDWLIEYLVPRGALSLLAGRPGEGKSTLALTWAAAVSRCGGRVVVLSAEDDPARVLRPRAEAAGAALERCYFVDLTQTEVDLPEGISVIENAVRSLGAELVIVDPINAFLSGTVDSHRDASLRRALRPLHELATESGAAVLAVSHLNKSTKADALSRIGGSVAYVAAARSVILAVSTEDGDGERRRFFGVVKSNYGPIQPPVEYAIRDVVLDGGIRTSVIEFRGEAPGVTIAELIEQRDKDTERSRVAEVAAALEEILLQGPVPANEAKTLLRQRVGAVSKKTVTEVKETLGVVSRRAGFGGDGEWVWELREVPTLKPEVSSKGFLPPTAESAKAEVDPKGSLAGIYTSQETLWRKQEKREHEADGRKLFGEDQVKRTDGGVTTTLRSAPTKGESLPTARSFAVKDEEGRCRKCRVILYNPESEAVGLCVKCRTGGADDEPSAEVSLFSL